MEDAGARRLEREHSGHFGWGLGIAVEPGVGLNGHGAGLDRVLHARRPVPFDRDGPARRQQTPL